MSARSSRSVPVETVAQGVKTTKQVLIGPDQGPNFALRKFRMESGGGMPLHMNSVEHEQYVLAGRARVTIGDEVLEVRAHDVVFIPAGVPHAYETLGSEPFEFLCVVPNRADFTRLLEDPDETGGPSPDDVPA